MQNSFRFEHTVEAIKKYTILNKQQLIYFIWNIVTISLTGSWNTNESQIPQKSTFGNMHRLILHEDSSVAGSSAKLLSSNL